MFPNIIRKSIKLLFENFYFLIVLNFVLTLCIMLFSLLLITSFNTYFFIFIIVTFYIFLCFIFLRYFEIAKAILLCKKPTFSLFFNWDISFLNFALYLLLFLIVPQFLAAYLAYLDGFLKIFSYFIIICQLACLPHIFYLAFFCSEKINFYESLKLSFKTLFYAPLKGLFVFLIFLLYLFTSAFFLLLFPGIFGFVLFTETYLQKLS